MKTKTILLQDLSSRLPHGVMIHFKSPRLEKEEDKTLFEIRVVKNNILINSIYSLEEVTPYLRPLSDMSEEEQEIYHSLCNVSYSETNYGDNEFSESEVIETYSDSDRSVDWLHKNHFDYRGLIPLGLALVAKKGMYRCRISFKSTEG